MEADLVKELGVQKISNTCPSNKWACPITKIHADAIGTLKVQVRNHPDNATAKRWAREVFNFVGKAHPELSVVVIEDTSGTGLGQVRRSDVPVLAGPAATSGQCQINITGSTRWVIDGSDTDYNYTAKPTCNASDWDVNANIYGPNSTYKDYWFFWAYKGSSRDYVTVDDYTKPGKYIFGSKRVSAYDSNYRSIRFVVTTPTIYARYRSTASISGTRNANRRVKLSGKIRRYRGGFNDDYVLRPGAVLIQRKGRPSGTFRTVKTLRGTNGNYSWMSGRTNSKQYYRVVMRQNATVWQATSNTIYR
ncbi:MAG: hypothetical protein J2P23_09780 [Microlunatus sp.]|nr:hypothetical protein [Microlunatus sp.]